jgi:hypothetical protein
MGIRKSVDDIYRFLDKLSEELERILQKKTQR